MCLSVPVALEPQSRKRTVTRSCIAFPSSIVSRSVFESWKAKTMSWSPFESSSELQMREAASSGSVSTGAAQYDVSSAAQQQWFSVLLSAGAWRAATACVRV